MASWGTGYRWHYYWTEQWILKNTKNLGGINFDVFFRCVMFWKESCVITNNKFHFPRSEKCLILLKFKGSLRRPPSYTITVVNRFCNVHWVFSVLSFQIMPLKQRLREITRPLYSLVWFLSVLLFYFPCLTRSHVLTPKQTRHKHIDFFFWKTNLMAGTSSLHFSFEMNLIIYSCACLSKAVTKLNIPLNLLIMFHLANNQFKSVGSPREKNGTYTNNTFAFFMLDWIVILRQNLCLFTDVC